MKRSLLALLALALVAPAPASAQEYLAPTYAATVQPDIEFGSAINARGQVERLLLDLHRPVGADGKPLPSRATLVFAHGGSFKNGTRRDKEIQGYLRRMAEIGYTTATIEYRLRPTGTAGSKPNQDLIVEAAAGDSDTLRDAQHDFQAAVRFLRANAATYGVDPERIAVGGSSAGAIAALQAAVNEEDPGTSGTPGVSSEVAAGIAVSGAADPDHIEAGDPPFLMFHGVQDATVPYPLGAQACALATALRNGCDLVTYPSGGHTPWAQWESDVVGASASFLCRTMRPAGVACGVTPFPLTIVPGARR